jgi:cytochrome b561
MTQRAFISMLILLAVAVALSATSFPGSLIGFLFAIGAVFFVAVPGTAVGNALHQAGIPATEQQLVWVLAGFYVLLILAAAIHTWLRRRDLDEARPAGLRLALLLALPLMGWLSTNAMVHAWP